MNTLARGIVINALVRSDRGRPAGHSAVLPIHDEVACCGVAA